MPGNVLIVDDSLVTRRMARRTMELAGLDVGNVYEAENGIQALAELNDHDVAVMLVDINMPTMNGVQLLTRMKTSERLRSIPVIIVSIEGSRERIEQLQEIGAFGYIRKPFQPEQLRDVLEPLIGMKDHVAAKNSDSSSDLL